MRVRNQTSNLSNQKRVKKTSDDMQNNTIAFISTMMVSLTEDRPEIMEARKYLLEKHPELRGDGVGKYALSIPELVGGGAILPIDGWDDMKTATFLGTDLEGFLRNDGGIQEIAYSKIINDQISHIKLKTARKDDKPVISGVEYSIEDMQALIPYEKNIAIIIDAFIVENSPEPLQETIEKFGFDSFEELLNDARQKRDAELSTEFDDEGPTLH